MNVIELCKQAGLTVGTNISGVTLVGSPSTPGIAHIPIDEMARFAALVRAEVLEEAAGVCETNADRWPGTSKVYAALECAAAIRALKEKT